MEAFHPPALQLLKRGLARKLIVQTLGESILSYSPACSYWKIFQQLQVGFVREKFPGGKKRHQSFHDVHPGTEEHQHRVRARGQTEQDLQHHHQSVQQVPPQHDCGPAEGKQVLSHPSPSHLQLQTSQRCGQVQSREAPQRYGLRACLRIAQIRLLQAAFVEEKWLEKTSEIILNLKHEEVHTTLHRNTLSLSHQRTSS